MERGIMEPLSHYSTNLTDAQWHLIEALLPAMDRSKGGRPRKYPLREIFNALFYQSRTGCQWRLLPKDFPPYISVWFYFRRWRDDGTLVRVHAALRKQVRKQAGRRVTPSALILDSQTVKTTQKGGLVAMMPAKRPVDASVTSL